MSRPSSKKAYLNIWPKISVALKSDDTDTAGDLLMRLPENDITVSDKRDFYLIIFMQAGLIDFDETKKEELINKKTSLLCYLWEFPPFNSKLDYTHRVLSRFIKEALLRENYILAIQLFRAWGTYNSRLPKELRCYELTSLYHLTKCIIVRQSITIPSRYNNRDILYYLLTEERYKDLLALLSIRHVNALFGWEYNREKATSCFRRLVLYIYNGCETSKDLDPIEIKNELMTETDLSLEDKEMLIDYYDEPFMSIYDPVQVGPESIYDVVDRGEYDLAYRNMLNDDPRVRDSFLFLLLEKVHEMEIAKRFNIQKLKGELI